MKNKFRIYDTQNRLMIPWEKLKHHPHLWQMVSGSMIGIIPMKSLGITSLNGNEVYEGDILLDSDDAEVYGNFPVVYSESKAAYCVDVSFLKDRTYLENLTDYFEGGNIEIIGNIHENPELLCK